MTRSSNAKVLNLKRLNVIYRSEAKHPLIDKLLYIQVQIREGDELPYLIYPCYLVGVELDKKNEKVEKFVLDIVQRINGQHGIARVKIPLSGMGKTWQMWNNPPSATCISLHPLDSKPLPARKKEVVVPDDVVAGKETY